MKDIQSFQIRSPETIECSFLVAMEYVGLSVSIIGSLLQSVQIMKEIIALRGGKKLEELYKGAEEKARDIHEDLANFKKYQVEIPRELGQFLKGAEEGFEGSKKELSDLQKVLVPSPSARHGEPQVLPRAEKLEKELVVFQDRCDWLSEGLASSQATIDRVVLKRVDEVGEKLDELRPDVFKPCFYVPANPVGVILKLDDPYSPEGALKRKLLDEEANDVVFAVDASPAATPFLTAVGMAGIGKTCALKGIGRDQEVRQRLRVAYTGYR